MRLFLNILLQAITVMMLFSSASLSLAQEIEKGTERPSIYQLDQKAVMVSTDYIWSITASYEKLVPVRDNLGAMLRIGAGPTFESGLDPVIMGQFSVLVGREVHFAEIGAAFYQTFRFYPSFISNFGYRYSGRRGLLVKIQMSSKAYLDPSWIREWGGTETWPSVQLGYRHVLKTK